VLKNTNGLKDFMLLLKKKLMNSKSLHILNTIIFLLLSNILFGQNFNKYYNYINKAELNIINNNFKNAILNYDSAFTFSVSPFAKDIHNAIICSEKLKLQDKLNDYSMLMLKNKSLKPSYYKKHNRKFYKAKKDEIKKKYIEKLNSYTYKLFEDLYKKDQKIRTNKNYTYGRDKIHKTDSLSFVAFKDYIAKNKFPDESFFLDNPFQNNLHLFVTHWHQAGFEIDSILLLAVKNLEFINIDYAYINEMEVSLHKNSKYGLVIMLNYHNKTKPIKRTNNDILQINKRRKEIGLCTYEEYIKKISFFKKDNDFYYQTGYSVVTIAGRSGKIVYDRFTN
jgi:hypothetical protein